MSRHSPGASAPREYVLLARRPQLEALSEPGDSGARRRRAQALEQQADRSYAHLECGLPHRGDGRLEQVRVVEPVEGGEGDIRRVRASPDRGGSRGRTPPKGCSRRSRNCGRGRPARAQLAPEATLVRALKDGVAAVRPDAEGVVASGQPLGQRWHSGVTGDDDEPRWPLCMRCSVRRRMLSRLSAPTWSQGAPSKTRSSSTIWSPAHRELLADLRRGLGQRARINPSTWRERRVCTARGLPLRVLGGVGEHQGESRSAAACSTPCTISANAGSPASETTSPMLSVLDRRMARAMASWRYPVLSIASITRLRVAGSTFLVPLKTCETVDVDTWANRATSTIVAMGPPSNVFPDVLAVRRRTLDGNIPRNRHCVGCLLALYCAFGFAQTFRCLPPALRRQDDR